MLTCFDQSMPERLLSSDFHLIAKDGPEQNARKQKIGKTHSFAAASELNSEKCWPIKKPPDASAWTVFDKAVPLPKQAPN